MPPSPQDVLCFSGRVAVFPPPPSERRLSQHRAGRIYRQGGRASGTLPGGAGRGRQGGVIYRGVRLRTTHTIFLQSSSVLGFCHFFLFAKTIILNKCRPSAVLFSSCRRRRLGVEWTAPHFHPARSSDASSEPAPATGRWRVCVGGGTSSNRWGRPVHMAYGSWPHGRQAPESLPRGGGETGRSDAERRGTGRGLAGGKTGRSRMAETLR